MEIWTSEISMKTFDYKAIPDNQWDWSNNFCSNTGLDISRFLRIGNSAHRFNLKLFTYEQHTREDYACIVE